MKIYIAGPMRGYAEFNFAAFDKAAAHFRSIGHEVFSPADNDRKNHGADFAKGTSGAHNDLQGTGFDLRVALKQDLAWICGEADAIAMLPGWEKSLGATAEHATAEALGLQVLIEGEFGWRARNKRKKSKASSSANGASRSQQTLQSP